MHATAADLEQHASSEGARHMVTEPWVSVDDVAAHLGVVRDSVYRWIERKGLPAHRIGRHWKFRLSQVDAWVLTGGAANDSSAPEAGR